jgi:periplasmic protein TonB
MFRFFRTAIIYLFTLNTIAQSAPKAAEIALDNEVFTNVEHAPEFVGGVKQMNEFIKSNLKYPPKVYSGKIEGKVFLKFIVEKDGTISNINMLSGMGFGCDEEAIRIVKLMPKWQSGTQKGKPIRVYYKLPIAFSLRKIDDGSFDSKMSKPDWYLPAYRRQ